MSDNYLGYCSNCGCDSEERRCMYCDRITEPYKTVKESCPDLNFETHTGVFLVGGKIRVVGHEDMPHLHSQVDGKAAAAHD